MKAACEIGHLLLQVTGLLGSHRRRTLLLWHAVELARLVDKSDATALRIAIKALQPSDTPLDVSDCAACPMAASGHPCR